MLPKMASRRLEAIIPLYVQLASRQKLRILGLSSPLSNNKDDLYNSGRSRCFSLILGSQVRQFCCCSTSSSNLESVLNSRRSSAIGKGGSVVRQQQDLPRITIYSNDNDTNDTAVQTNYSSGGGGGNPINRPGYKSGPSVAEKRQHGLSSSSQKLLGANKDLEREVWRAARNYRNSDHYDYSLFGLNPDSDRAVGKHQRETMLYNQGASIGGAESAEEEEPSANAAAEDDMENEENLHERMHRQRHQKDHNHNHHHNQHHHHHHQQQHARPAHEHVKELIKPDRTIRVARTVSAGQGQPKMPNNTRSDSPRVATVVDEEQLHKRFVESVCERRKIGGSARDRRSGAEGVQAQTSPSHETQIQASKSSSISSSSSKSQSSSRDSGPRSPPPAAIIIPPDVAKSMSNRSKVPTTSPGKHPSNDSQGSITKEQLEYGPLLKKDEVQVLYRNPISDSNDMNRHLKDEQAKLVAPNIRQSPIAIMTMNPTYELQNKPLVIEYPATLENLRLNNTGFSWEVKIPYQISMTTALYGAHLNTSYCYRLDQFHCHWGPTDDQGSEHTVDNKCYSAELHFVHYNMEKYHTMSKAARHPDGLVVVSVFLDAQADHHNHAELEKIVSQLKSVALKGEHAIIRQAVRIENLLPSDRSYWSYQGSLTTPPYFESVTWFVLKHPIRCSKAQIQKFRNLRSSLHRADESAHITTNHRKTQPLNGRSIVNYDETSGLLRSSRSIH